MNTPKKEEVKKNNRERKVKKKCVKEHHDELSPEPNTQSQSFRRNPNYYTIHMKSNQIKLILGKDSKMYCDVLSHVLYTTVRNPELLCLLREKFVLCERKPSNVSENIDETLVKMPSSTELCREIRKISVLRSTKKHEKASKLSSELKSKFPSVNQIAKVTGEKIQTVHRILSTPKKRQKKVYTKKLSNEIKEEAIQAYFDDEVSYSLPDIKYTGLHFMSLTILEAYEQHYLVKAKSERKMSFKAFCNLRPPSVRTIQQTPLRGCKCKYCQNLGIMHDKLIGLGLTGIPKNHACSIEVTWCPFRKSKACVSSFHNKKSDEISNEKLKVILESDENCDENGDEQCDENGAQVKSDEISQVKSEAMTQSDE